MYVNVCIPTIWYLWYPSPTANCHASPVSKEKPSPPTQMPHDRIPGDVFTRACVGSRSEDADVRSNHAELRWVEPADQMRFPTRRSQSSLQSRSAPIPDPKGLGGIAADSMTGIRQPLPALNSIQDRWEEPLFCWSRLGGLSQENLCMKKHEEQNTTKMIKNDGSNKNEKAWTMINILMMILVVPDDPWQQGIPCGIRLFANGNHLRLGNDLRLTATCDRREVRSMNHFKQETNNPGIQECTFFERQ